MSEQEFIQISPRLHPRVYQALRMWARDHVRTQQSIVTEALHEYFDLPGAFTDYVPKRGPKYKAIEHESNGEV